MPRVWKISFTVLVLILVGLLVFSGYMAFQEALDQKKDKEVFDELAKLVETPVREEASRLPYIVATDDLENRAEEQETEETEAAPSRRNLTPLFEQNTDFLGWLCIPDTAVNYPVVHTPADPERYLHLNFYGEYSASGVPFLDHRCVTGSDNLIIYGHNMKNGTIFGSLKQYLNKSYLAEHPIIEWETSAGCERYAVFAVAVVKKSDSWYSFISADGTTDWGAYILRKATLTTELVPTPGQKFLTLSTCYGSGEDGRLLVIAAKI